MRGSWKRPLLLLLPWLALYSDAASSFERHLTSFSPEGRLFQVEFASNAVERHGQLCVALVHGDTCVVATTRTPRPRLAEPGWSECIHRVTGSTGCAVVGLDGDGLAVVDFVRDRAVGYRASHGHEMPPSLLALDLADEAQSFTQQAPQRPLGTTALLFGPAASPWAPQAELYRVDPTGQLFACSATVAGRHADAAAQWLRDHPPQAPPKDTDATAPPTPHPSAWLLRTALQCLRHATDGAQPGSAWGPADVELALATADRGFHHLNEGETAALLQWWQDDHKAARVDHPY